MDSRIEQRLNNLNKKTTVLPYERLEQESCSLRKRVLEKAFMKKRLSAESNSNANQNSAIFNSKYNFTFNTLAIPKEILEKQINNLEEQLSFVMELMTNYNNCNNSNEYIAFAIILMKTLTTLKDDSLLIKYKIPTLILDQLQSKLSNLIFINELLWVLINISYSPSPKVCNLFATESYLVTYKNILIQYCNDSIIKQNILQLFGNLVSQNKDIQKTFYETKLLDLVIRGIQSTPKEMTTIEKDLMLWFLACFTCELCRNAYFFKHKELIVSIHNIFIDNILNESYRQNCLLGLCNTSEFEYTEMTDSFLKNNGAMITFLFNLPVKHHLQVNVIVCNLSSIDNDTDKQLIGYGLVDFIERGLKLQSVVIQSESLWSLRNLIIVPEMAQLVYDRGFIPIIINMIEERLDRGLVSSSIKTLNNIVFESNEALKPMLIHYKFLDVYLTVLAKSIDEKIVCKAIKGLNLLFDKFRVKGNNSLLFDEFERKGGRDLLDQMIDSVKEKVANKANELYKKYYSQNNNPIAYDLPMSN